MKIRKAVKEDSESLSKLAYKSKAYWGFRIIYGTM